MSELKRQQSFGYQVNHLARLFARALDAKLKPLGLATGQMPVLLALFEKDGQTQAELCKLVRVEQPTLANTLGRMHRDGLVERRADPSDGRRMQIYLSAHTAALKGEVIAAAQAVNGQAVDGLAADEQDQALTLMARMIANLDPAEGEA